MSFKNPFSVLDEYSVTWKLPDLVHVREAFKRFWDRDLIIKNPSLILISWLYFLNGYEAAEFDLARKVKYDDR